jgi:hypothetical protein
MHTVSSPAQSPASFVEGLAYSQQRGTGKRNVYGSLARLSQELGAELCGRLSQTVLQQSLSTSPKPQRAAVAGDDASQIFMTDVQRDLSAHYGSHALRRGLAKPFGPCVRPQLRKGKFTVAGSGVHGPRCMRLWKLRLVRRCWCPRCGVWLTRGSDINLKKKSGCGTLSTVVDCRVRQGGRRRRHNRRRQASSKAFLASAKFAVCCIRCFQREHQAAARAAGQQLCDSNGKPPSDAVAQQRGSRPHTTARTAAALQLLRQKCENAVAAVVAAARVPKRSRRCHRHSARRPRKDPATAPRSKAKATPSTAAVATAARLHQVLASSLAKTAAKAAGLTASLTSSATASADTKPPLVRAAQRSLQGLVPSGPLKKSKNVPRPADTTRSSLAAAVDGEHKAGCASSELPTTGSPRSSGTVNQFRPTAAEQGRKESTTHVKPRAEMMVVAVDSKADEMPPVAPSVARKEDAAVAVEMCAPPAKVSAATLPTKKPIATAATASGGVPPAPAKRATAASGMSTAASQPLSAAPLGRLPAKAAPKKSLAPLAKAQTKINGKAKLLDAMSQLGF